MQFCCNVLRSKEAEVIDVAVPSDSNIRKKEKLGKYQGLKEELERMRKVKAKGVQVGEFRAVTPKLEE